MACLVCGANAVTEQLDVGSHPVSSFFLKEASAPERNFRLSLGQCDQCGTIQIMKAVPHDALVPPYDWLFAREPEELGRRHAVASQEAMDGRRKAVARLLAVDHEDAAAGAPQHQRGAQAGGTSPDDDDV